MTTTDPWTAADEEPIPFELVPRRTITDADEQLCRYAYWSERARFYADDEATGGRAGECYRAAAEMAARALGRYDVLHELAAGLR